MDLIKALEFARETLDARGHTKVEIKTSNDPLMGYSKEYDYSGMQTFILGKLWVENSNEEEVFPNIEKAIDKRTLSL